MTSYASVVVESDLLQLDREFDFVVPGELENLVKVGQRVKFQLGRTKKLATGFITNLPKSSAFATSELSEIVDLEPVLQLEILQLARLVANRQAVALGEILQQAVVEHMPRISKPAITENALVTPELPVIPGVTNFTDRQAVLTSARSITFNGLRYPDWCWLFANAASKSLKSGKSAIFVLPERDQIAQLSELFMAIGFGEFTSTWLPGAKKSERFTKFHEVLAREHSIVIGSRSAIFAPANNLGLIAMFDDGDDSLREQG
ncbi:MAG: hypothetical protein RIR71_417, partial [Actinomycetota bacterium]